MGFAPYVALASALYHFSFLSFARSLRASSPTPNQSSERNLIMPLNQERVVE
jgi:hypothetical protein